jgi:DNA-binding XRE family transcriptional regulator
MMEFWDKKLSEQEIKDVLKNENHPRFLEFASLFLSRTNDIRMVFSDYLEKKVFWRNWKAIKRRMSRNKWNDPKIIYWNGVYDILKKDFKKEKAILRKSRPPIVPRLKEFGDIIRAAREKRGLTQKELADRSGVSQVSISFIERGVVNVSVLTLENIARVLGLTVSIVDQCQPSFDRATINVSSTLSA